ncbi:MAG: hypothetical protein ABL961_18150 [Vicinamibacterales bacterium]
MAQATSLLIIIALAVLASEAPVHAYLDPGAGSMLLQVVLGGVAALGVFVRLFWHRLTSAFRKQDSGNKKRA